MPSNAEAVLIVIFFIAPGFTARRLISSLISVVKRSVFAETVESVLISTLIYLVLTPIWLPFLKILYAPPHPGNRAISLSAAFSELTAAHLMSMGLLVLVLLPIVCTIVWVYVVKKKLGHKFFSTIFQKFGVVVKISGGPELWDRLFEDREYMPWVRIHLDNGQILQGTGVEFSDYPSDRQVWVTNPKLYDENWKLVRDLEQEGAEGVFLSVEKGCLMEIFPG